MAQCSLDVGVSPRVSVRFPPDVLVALDGLIVPGVLSSRSDVVRFAVQQLLHHTPHTTHEEGGR